MPPSILWEFKHFLLVNDNDGTYEASLGEAIPLSFNRVIISSELNTFESSKLLVKCSLNHSILFSKSSITDSLL